MRIIRLAVAAVLTASLASLPAVRFASAAAPETAPQPGAAPSPYNGVPVAPTGLQDQPLGDGPWDFRTAEQQDIRVTVVARGLEYPYALAFLPNGDLLLTERAGRLRLVRGGRLDPQPVSGGPASRFAGKSGGLGAVHGYMSLAVHPRFAENGLVYFSYTKPTGEKTNAAAVARAKLAGNALTDVRDLLVMDGVRGAVALAMTPDAKLYVGTSADAEAQDPDKLGGKVLRLNDDGSVPQDNPFVGRAGHRPEVYSMGHRSALALAVVPGSGEVLLSEMGPNGGDEINVIRPGRNYGWPKVSFGRTYPGPWQTGNMPTHEGFDPPIVYWMPAISVSGLAVYTGDRLPRWKGDLFVGGLRYGEVPGTGRLDRVRFNGKMEELRRESLLGTLHQRIRDVKQGPDGLLYVATDEAPGAILRIEPR